MSPSNKPLSGHSHSPIFSSSWTYTHVPLILAKGSSIIPSGHVLGCLLETAVLPVFVWIQYFLKWKSPWQQLQSLITEQWKWCWYLWGNLCSQNNVPLTMEWIFPANITIKKKIKKCKSVCERNLPGNWRVQGIGKQEWSLLSVAPELKSNHLLLAINTGVLGRAVLICLWLPVT